MKKPTHDTDVLATILAAPGGIKLAQIAQRLILPERQVDYCLQRLRVAGKISYSALHGWTAVSSSTTEPQQPSDHI